MNIIQKTKYRLQMRGLLQKADWQLLQIYKEELHREFERRRKDRK